MTNHIVGCKHMLPLRTKLWHDPLVKMWHQLANMPGQSCGSEVTNLTVNLNMRADVAACRSPRGVDYHAKEDLSRVAHATPALNGTVRRKRRLA